MRVKPTYCMFPPKKKDSLKKISCLESGSVPFDLVPALVLTWHHVKIMTGRTIVGGVHVVSGAKKKIIMESAGNVASSAYKIIGVIMRMSLHNLGCICISLSSE